MLTRGVCTLFYHLRSVLSDHLFTLCADSAQSLHCCCSTGSDHLWCLLSEEVLFWLCGSENVSGVILGGGIFTWIWCRLVIIQGMVISRVFFIFISFIFFFNGIRTFSFFKCFTFLMYKAFLIHTFSSVSLFSSWIRKLLGWKVWRPFT